MLFSPLALFCRRAVQLVGCKSHPASLCPSASRMVGGSWLVAAWGDSPSQLQPHACVLVALGQCPLLPEEQNHGLPVGGGNTLGFFCARREPGGGSGFVRPCWGLVWGRDSHTVKCSVSSGGLWQGCALWSMVGDGGGSSQGSKHCSTMHMGPFSPAQVQFSMETPKQMVLFYPGYYSTNNTQVLHTFASLRWREGPG